MRSPCSARIIDREPLTIQTLYDDRYLEAALREIGIVADGP
jgi:hypothetical protein